jgi:hypothetical protein
VRPADHALPVLGTGLGFLLAGVLFLLQELGLLAVGWAVLLPALLVVVGAATALAGVAGARRVARTRP